MSDRYDNGLKALMDGDVDLLSDTISLQMYSGAAVFDASHEFLDEVAGTQEGAAITLTGKDTTDGLLTATVGAFTPPADSVIVALVLYVDTGVDSTSRLLAFIDKKSDGTAISIEADGSSFYLYWNGPIYSIGGI